jgi:RNA polymerase sigma factor (sigma-70 family)
VDSESGLVDASVAGDRDAFDELVKRYQVPILGLARALLAGSPDAEDVAQEIFVRVWRSMKGFRGDCPFRSWLYRIAVNVIITHQRRLMRERRLFRTPAAHEPVRDADRVAAASDSQPDVLLRMTLDQALAQIPIDNRTAIVLRDVQGLDYREIAQTLRVPIGTVESRIFRARQRLRTLLRPVALCIAILMLLSAQARAQCRIEGKVLSAAGAPLADATIRVTGPELKTPLTTQTDREGRYGFKDVKAGIRVEIRVITEGRPVALAFSLVANWVETVDIKVPPEVAAPSSAEDLDPGGGAAGEVRGVVRANDGSSVAGARVFIADTPVGTATDSAGRYTFGKLRAGLRLQLRVAADGYDTATDDVSVPSGGAADVDFALEAVGPADDRGAASAIQQLSRDSQFLTLRGAPSDRSVTTYDGFNWYPFSRLFVDFGGLTPAPVAQVGPSAKPSGGVDLSAFGTAGNVSIPMGDRGSLVLAGRRSVPGTIHGDVLDQFDPGTGEAVRDRVPRYSGGTFQARPDPGFYDVNARLELTPGRNNRISVSLYDARDEENFSRDQSLPASSTSIAVPVDFQLPSDALVQAGDAQSWKGRAMSASWRRTWSPAVTTTATVSRSRFSKTHDQGFFLTSPSTGVDYAVPAGREDSSGLSERNEMGDTTVKFVASIRAGFRHAFDVGGDVVALDADYAAQTEATRSTSAALRGPSTLMPLLQRTTTGKTVTLFAQDTWRPAGRLVVSPGLRLTHYDLAGSSYVDPRVSASYPVAPRVELNAAWSIDHQVASDITREDREHGDGDFWVLSDSSAVPVARTQQVAGGLSAEAPGVRFDGRLFYKRFDDVTMFAPRPLPGDARSAGTTPFYVGSGTSAGLELQLEQHSNRNGLRATYTVARTEYTYPALEAAAFPASNDQRHQFRIVDWLPLRAGWSVGGAWFVAQGSPVTPLQSVQQVWFPSGQLAYQALFGPRNSDRVLPYHRLDLSSQIVHRFAGVTSTVGATVFNVYNRDNVLFHDYETVGSSYGVSDISMMRRAVNVFLKVGF